MCIAGGFKLCEVRGDTVLLDPDCGVCDGGPGALHQLGLSVFALPAVSWHSAKLRALRGRCEAVGLVFPFPHHPMRGDRRLRSPSEQSHTSGNIAFNWRTRLTRRLVWWRWRKRLPWGRAAKERNEGRQHVITKRELTRLPPCLWNKDGRKQKNKQTANEQTKKI